MSKLKPKSLFIKNEPIKLASSGELIDEKEFSTRIDQVKWILNSVIDGSKAELFGSKKYEGWCNQKEKVRKIIRTVDIIKQIVLDEIEF